MAASLHPCLWRFLVGAWPNAHLTMQQRWWRAGCLFGCQGIVNVSSPHLFELFTPGVLSLLGVLILTEPWWGRGYGLQNKPTVVFSWVFGLTVLFCFVFTSWQGPSSWNYLLIRRPS